MAFELTVPIKYHNAASIIANLGVAKMHAVVSFLNDASYPFSLGNDQARDYSALEAAEIQSPEEVVEFIASLFYLYHGLESGHTEDEMVEGITQYFLREQPVESLSDYAQADRLGGNLRKIINTNTALDLTAKVALIKNDHPHAYANAKIYTDMRPVFCRSDMEIRGAVIIHTLKLSYQDGQERKDFFVALDQADLVSLRESVEKAERKEATLRKYSSLKELQLYE